MANNHCTCLCLHILTPLRFLLYPQELWWGQKHGGDVPQIQEEMNGWLQVEVGASLSCL